MRDDDQSPISASDAKTLFAGWRNAPALVLAVSGGPDSVALMWLFARWRRALSRGPHLIAVTVDHGLRTESAREARDVKRLARSLEIEHRTMKWTGAKPKNGIPAAARAARYRLLADAAKSAGATHILTAHTSDDQAETVLMRLFRGSGIAGLSAMARESMRDGVVLARPLLSVPKSRLVATLGKAGIAYADDPTNRDLAFARPRLRALLPMLAAEGGDARGLARLAARLGRANEAVEVLADGAERYLALRGRAPPRQEGREFDAEAFAALPEEIRLRLLIRAINAFGHEGPAELGKAETLLAQMDRCFAANGAESSPKRAQIHLKQTLAGALVSVSRGRVLITPAPKRRRGSASTGGK
ncbi:MAG TPA: tRNA lysidine(34) synthetase TilS [Bradyrhizobium sp.]|uniref:tRNA lysidine(34) synthetase TilS n=1 Tax=Bradyrhizobium sp. TaxID=376 RepID=UPI002C69D168|nr:tRNA lysidine(34) synthetase TilS [Bradyrhizobium sp.]HLZ04038.1 tRNA lysidine(34) synthetase TilS [Bradyrhizobium sp.]